MKSTIKTIFSIALSLVFLSSLLVDAFAYEYGSFDLNSLVEIQHIGSKEIRTINSDVIKRLKGSKSLEFKNMNDKEKLNALFEAVGFGLNKNEKNEVHDTLSISHIENIRVIETYIKVDEKGEQEIISKEKAINAAIEKNSALNSKESYVMATSDTGPTASHGNEEPIIDPDDYMAQLIGVFYTPNYHGTGTTTGRYVVMATFDWLTIPTARKTDCMGLYTDQFNWYDRIAGEDSNYAFTASYTETLYDNSGLIVSSEEHTVTKNEDDAVISNDVGFCFEYNLKSNLLLLRYSDFEFFITGVCRVKNYDDPTQSLAISSDYLHIKNILSISPSFSIGPFGISVSQIHTPQHFYGSHEWDYNEDYYA